MERRTNSPARAGIHTVLGPSGPTGQKGTYHNRIWWKKRMPPNPLEEVARLHTKIHRVDAPHRHSR